MQNAVDIRMVHLVSMVHRLVCMGVGVQKAIGYVADGYATCTRQELARAVEADQQGGGSHE